jgi:hypothetical protein
MVCGAIRQIANKNIHRAFPYGRGYIRSPGQPNSTQEYRTQEHYAGETAKRAYRIHNIICNLIG